MGNNQQILHIQIENPSIKSKGFQNSLVLLGSYNHPHLRLIQLYKYEKSNQSNPCLFSKIIVLNSNQKILQQEHQERCRIQHKYILQYIGYCSNYLALEGNLYEIRLYYEYQQKNLKSLEKKPQECLIWKIIFQIIEACQYLAQNGKFHGDLNMFSIFLDQQQNIKILYNSAFPDLISQYTKQINYMNDGQNFLAFQALHSYRKNRKNKEFDPYKQDSYSLGMTLLELISGQNSKDCYNDNHIQHHIIQQRLIEAKTQYSSQLILFIQCLLNVDERLRPAIHSLLQYSIPRPIKIVYK